jgi:hypothetical protein
MMRTHVLQFLAATDVRPLVVTVVVVATLHWVDALMGPFVRGTNPFLLWWLWIVVPSAQAASSLATACAVWLKLHVWPQLVHAVSWTLSTLLGAVTAAVASLGSSSSNSSNVSSSGEGPGGGGHIAGAGPGVGAMSPSHLRSMEQGAGAGAGTGEGASGPAGQSPGGSLGAIPSPLASLSDAVNQVWQEWGAPLVDSKDSHRAVHGDPRGSPDPHTPVTGVSHSGGVLRDLLRVVPPDVLRDIVVALAAGIVCLVLVWTVARWHRTGAWASWSAATRGRKRVSSVSLTAVFLNRMARQTRQRVRSRMATARDSVTAMVASIGPATAAVFSRSPMHQAKGPVFTFSGPAAGTLGACVWGVLWARSWVLFWMRAW